MEPDLEGMRAASAWGKSRMKTSLQSLVITEMTENQIPRSTRQIALDIAAKTGRSTNSSCVSTVMQTLKNHRDHALDITGPIGARKYRLKPSLKEISQQVEQQLWALRRAREKS